MSPSPLQFARDWERLTSDVAGSGSADHRLLLAIDFWPTLAEVADKAQYASYREEYLTLLPKLITLDALTDLALDELEHIRRVLMQIAEVKQNNVSISELLDSVTYHLASLLCWLGEPEQAIAAMGERPPDLPESEDRPHEAMRLLRWYLQQLPEDHGARRTLKRIYDHWQGYQDAVWDDRVNCLLVDYQGGKPRGRMRTLTGVVETRGARRSKDRTEDHVAVDTQLKSPDDPFAGVIYKALKAVRTELHRSGMSRTYRNELLNADFFLNEGHITLTGDSIGLAAALIAYAQLLKPEVMRHEKYISGGIAVTGAIDEQGNALPVSEESLSAKVTRAFHSPVSALVLPQEHVEVATKITTDLQHDYPHRRLHIIAASQLSETVQDRNIIRSEKVCMGQYMVRTVNKYTRATKVQVPVLLLLGYLLLCLLYPKAWIWFDRNPAEVEIVPNGFIVYNADGDELWRQTYPWELNTERMATRATIDPRSFYTIVDLDDDPAEEVIFCPTTVNRSPMPDSMKNRMFIYDDNGTLVASCPSVMFGEYPGDTVRSEVYLSSGVVVLQTGQYRIIVTESCLDNPARGHQTFWSTDGELLGWYITNGYGARVFSLLGPDTLATAWFNNRLNRAMLSIISPSQVRGVSPPYELTPAVDLRHVRRAEHIACAVFPATDVRAVSRTRYSKVDESRMLANGGLLVKTIECENRATGRVMGCMYYYLTPQFRIERVSAEDGYKMVRDTMVDAGNLPAIPWDVYSDSLARAVEYWTDSGWVTEGQLRDAEAAQAALSDTTTIPPAFAGESH